MEYPEALSFLYGLTRFGLRLGLDVPRRLAAVAGVPAEGLRFIHVAGTNGKGSTCAFLEEIYRRTGLRVGLYTSPHLVSFRERIQVNREPIPEAELANLVAWLRPHLEGFSGGESPTFFEFVTVMALEWFRRQACDLVVWETGMGGRLDATNIVTPLLGVITNVGWDHMQWLGPTLPEIAREKAGILKPGVPAVTAADDPEVLEVLRGVSRDRGTTLQVVEAGDADSALAAATPLSLQGQYQQRNAALAIAAVHLLEPILPVPPGVIVDALRETRWPGRFEIIRHEGHTLVLDGAHNRSAFQALAQALAAQFEGRRHALILGMLADKDVTSAAEILVPGAARVVVVPVQTPRAGDPVLLATLCQEAVPDALVEQADSLGEALDRLASEEVVVVTGSLYLVGEAMDWIAGGAISERQLNDWCPTR